MGAVYSAIDDRERTPRRVEAPRATCRAAKAALFEREYHVLSRSRHPRIIEVYDYGVDAEGPYYTMELLDGADLRELSPLPWPRACRYLRDVASSLALLHARRLLHRDVSPRNVRTLPTGAASSSTSARSRPSVPARSSSDAAGIPPEALLGSRSTNARICSRSARSLTTCSPAGTPIRPARWASFPKRGARNRCRRRAMRKEFRRSSISSSFRCSTSIPLARPGSASEVIERLQAVGELPPDQ